jgi:hypothetical protein
VRTKGRQIVHESRPRPRSPFFLYGPKVFEESKQLPNGAYYVSASPRENGWGRLVFTQQCADVQKGGQMMMKARRLRPNRT